jgi:hypothetical protein
VRASSAAGRCCGRKRLLQVLLGASSAAACAAVGILAGAAGAAAAAALLQALRAWQELPGLRLRRALLELRLQGCAAGIPCCCGHNKGVLRLLRALLEVSTAAGKRPWGCGRCGHPRLRRVLLGLLALRLLRRCCLRCWCGWSCRGFLCGMWCRREAASAVCPLQALTSALAES